MADAGRELDEHLPPVVEGPQRPPGRIIALDAVGEIQGVNVNAGGDGRRRIGGGVLLAQRDELVFGIKPGHCRLISLVVSGFQSDVGDLAGRRIDLIEGPSE